MGHHKKILTPIHNGVEMPELTQPFCGTIPAMFQKMEQISQSIKHKYQTPYFVFKIECTDCRKIHYLADGVLYDEQNFIVLEYNLPKENQFNMN